MTDDEKATSRAIRSAERAARTAEKKKLARKKHNVSKMIAFFESSDPQNYREKVTPRRKAIMLTDNPQTMLAFIQLIFSHQDEVKHLLKWANLHKMAVNELTAEDLEEVQNHFKVAEVHSL